MLTNQTGGSKKEKKEKKNRIKRTIESGDFLHFIRVNYLILFIYFPFHRHRSIPCLYFLSFFFPIFRIICGCISLNGIQNPKEKQCKKNEEIKTKYIHQIEAEKKTERKIVKIVNSMFEDERQWIVFAFRTSTFFFIILMCKSD